jgi:hypothetical protein
MATCRVYLCTYRRHALLRRAINSLRCQTFTDWVCDLHNDDPADGYPRELVREIGDPRITVVDHPQRLGPTRTFSLVYRTVAEPYVSMLEDDNWWEPRFLETMIETLEGYPEAALAWANMRIWEEQDDATWRDTGACTWEAQGAAEPEAFFFPNPRQASGALHSHGAAVHRSQGIERYEIPMCTTSAAVEPVRERVFRYPILLVPAPLANFARTRRTSRSDDLAAWMHIQLVLTASYFKHVPTSREALADVWRNARSGPARATNTLLLAGLFPGCGRLLGPATAGDAIRLLRSCVRHPLAYSRVAMRLARQGELWAFLDRNTHERVHEVAARVTT